MHFIGMGCLSFIFFYLFDLNKIFLIHKWISIFFAIGVVLLTVSTMALWFGNFMIPEIFYPMQWLWGALSFISLSLMIYTLFLGIPFTKTYIEFNKENFVVDTGVYALCRHPGVIWFFFFYLFLWLASGKIILMWAAIVWTFMDIIYVYVQDRWLFPKTLIGYDAYKSSVPFLIPDLVSIRKCMQSFNWCSHLKN